MAANTDLLTKVGLPGSATTLASPGHTIAGTSITVDSTSLWPTDTGVIFGMDTVTLVNGEEVRDVNSYTVWEGVVTSATGIGSMVLKHGTDQNYPAGSTTRVYILPSVIRENQVVDWGLEEHDQDGTHAAITATSVTATTGTFTNLTVSGTATSQGWTALGDVPDLVTANGNRNYDLRFDGVDHTSTLSPGMKLQLTRTVAAPYQCTSLNGTTQYYSKSSPAGLSFTTAFTCSAWVKLSSYATAGIIARRNADTEGFSFGITSSGQLSLYGLRIAGNNAVVNSYASLPLNRWVHVAASYDLSTATAATYFDGVEVSSLKTVTGTCAALVQGTTALVVGAEKSAGTNPFPGKIAQAAVYSAVLSATTIKNSMDRTLTGSETSLISAYSFNGVLTDLNANANTLTAQGSAVATNADSPFANAVTAGLIEYAEVNSVTFSTNTTVNVRVPDTCQIPTSGGVSAVSYSTQSNPYGLPAFSRVLAFAEVKVDQTIGTANDQTINGLTCTPYVPAGSKVKVKYFSGAVLNATAGITGYFTIYDGSVSSTTNVRRSVFLSPGAGYLEPMVVEYIATIPTAGVKTFIAGFSNTASTLHSTGDGYNSLLVELV